MLYNNPVSIITRAALAGTAAGLVAALFFLTVSRTTLDEAVDFETQSSETTENGQTNETAEESADVSLSRNTQAVGAVVAMLMYGSLVGVVFGTIFVAVRHRLVAATDFGRALQLAIIGFVATVVLPAVKYPANPPGIGNPDNVNQRTVIFLTLIGAALAAASGLVALYPWLKTRLIHASANTLTALLVLTVSVVLLVAWPSDTSVVPDTFPADLLWRFRLQSFATQTITWGGLGLFTGWLLSLSPRSGKILDLNDADPDDAASGDLTVSVDKLSK